MDLLTLAAAVEAAATGTSVPVKRARKSRKAKIAATVDPVVGTGGYVRTALDALADNSADPIGRGLWVA